MENYDKVAKVVTPKRTKLEEAIESTRWTIDGCKVLSGIPYPEYRYGFLLCWKLAAANLYPVFMQLEKPTGEFPRLSKHFTEMGSCDLVPFIMSTRDGTLYAVYVDDVQCLKVFTVWDDIDMNTNTDGCCG
eukprot:Gb_30938 [translate_table: standard]